MIKLRDASPELRAAAIGMKKASKDTRKQINDGMRSTFNPIWKQSLAQTMGGYSKLDSMMLQGSRIRAGNPPELVAATSRRTFGRALKPAEHWPLVEYGASGTKISEYQRRNRTSAGTHTVRRRTMSGLPPRTRSGRIATPAAKDILPRMASYFIQSVLKTWADMADATQN